MSDIVLETTTEMSGTRQMDKVLALIEDLNTSSIRYCHWKSNFALAQSLAGQTDIDVLVHRQDADAFRAVLTRLGFRPGTNKDGGSFPAMEHHFAFDESTGVIVHVHAYFQVITGDSLVKNYRLPIEGMLLDNTRPVNSIPVPAAGAELIVFTLRMMMKHTSLLELILLKRYWKQVKAEIQWLKTTGSLQDSLELLQTWLPSIKPELFSACLRSLEMPAPLPKRILLGLRMRAQLKIYARYSSVHAGLAAVQKFGDMVYRRLVHSHNELAPRSGGAVIAFVGSEATGKSTMIEETSEWLGEHFAVERIHAGKPKSTLITFVPNLLLPALRSLFPGARASRLEAENASREPGSETPKALPFITVIRAALLAFDRRALLLKAFRKAANGTIILSDRYPSQKDGAPDSPQLGSLIAGKGLMHGWLARSEAGIYRQIPPPDLVIYLKAPLEITLTRNANRGKKEPEQYVRVRHGRTANLQFASTQVCEINTDQPFDQTILEVKKAIWNIL